jgi:hypothetical protein
MVSALNRHALGSNPCGRNGMMAVSLAATHPVATQHIPAFITEPGQTDVLMVATALILGVAVMGFGLVFLRIHTLPERMAHRGHKLQFEIVAVLGLLALFTHIHLFWVAGLLLALIDIPDFGGHLKRIAGGVEKMAGIDPRPVESHSPPGDEPRPTPAHLNEGNDVHAPRPAAAA